MSRTYSKRYCHICGEYVNSCGFAFTSHMRRHVKEGLCTEDRTMAWMGGNRFYQSVKWPKVTKEVDP